MNATTNVSRRHFLRFGAASALGLGLAASGLALPGSDSTQVGATYPTVTPYPPTKTPAPPTVTPTLVPTVVPTVAPTVVVGPAPTVVVPFVAYHNLTGDQHQSRFNDLAAAGYRVLSFNISGAPDNPRYAAVWVQKAGAAQRVVHGITAAEYQQWFDQGNAEGFVPTIVSATGPAATARFAAVAEKGIAPPWVARHNIDADTYDFQTVKAVNDNLIARTIAMYGDPGSGRRFAGAWLANTKSLDWPTVTDVSPEAYQTAFNSLTAKGYYPRYLTVAADGRLSAIFASGAIGAWVARHNLTSEQYQQAFDENNAKGFVPVCVQAGGAGSNRRFAALFVTQAGLPHFL